jgi:beta-mannosidase
MIELPPHTVRHWDVETLIGRFVDAAWAYRFGPPAQDLIVASLEQREPHDSERGERARELLSQSVRFPAGRPLAGEPAARLGLVASACELDDTTVRLSVHSDRFAYGVRIHVPGFHAADDAFSVEPSGKRSVLLHAREDGAVFAGGWLTALNLQGRVTFSAGERPPANRPESIAAPRLAGGMST